MRDEIKKYKQKYDSIGTIICPTLNNEKVYFNNHGFRHLIRKGRIPRSKKERQSRLVLIKFIRSVLEKGELIEIRKEYKGDENINTFWCIECIVKTNKIRVIVRKIQKGKIHFLSIYSA